jgi:hypothetical protein
VKFEYLNFFGFLIILQCQEKIRIVAVAIKYLTNNSFLAVFIKNQGLPVLTVGTSMAVTFTHVFLWGSSATNHIEKALMGSPC